MNIKENIIIKRLDILKNKLNYSFLSCNKYLPFNYVLKNPELPWDYYNLTYSKNITLPAAKYFR
jgi:hypothetical protein